MRNIVFIVAAIGTMVAGAIITLNIGNREMAKCKSAALSFRFE